MNAIPPTTRGADPPAPHRGPLILALGLLSFVTCGLFCPIAWIMANHDLRQMRTGRIDPAGRGLTRAGKICGILGLVFSIVAAVVLFLWFFFFYVLAAGPAPPTPAGGG